MIIQYKVSNRKWNGQEVRLCGEFQSVEVLRKRYEKFSIEWEHGWYIVPCSIEVVRSN